MRVWDISPRILCRQHLLGEHRELHGLWNIHVHHKQGYSRHPETCRWQGKLKALYLRHELLVKEMTRRGYRHASPLNRAFATGTAHQRIFIHTVKEQKEILRKKKCDCRV
jgi:hypothetical protein